MHVPESGASELGIAPCLCGERYNPNDPEAKVRIVEPQRIGGKDHPARGVVVGKGYGYCKNCGIKAAEAKTTEEVIANWNRLVGFSSSKTS